MKHPIQTDAKEFTIRDNSTQEFADDMLDFFGCWRGGHIARHGYVGKGGVFYSQWLTANDLYRSRVTQAEIELITTYEKVLAEICEGDTNFCASDYNQYRWISKDIFQAVPFYIYGETLAIMDFETAPGPTIILLKSRAITNAYVKQFQAFWHIAYVPPSLDQKA